MSDTPRTDAVLKNWSALDEELQYADAKHPPTWAMWCAMRDHAFELERENARLREALNVTRTETAQARAMFDSAITRLTRITSFVHPDGFVVNGKGYSFHPPIELVREAWEALSKAIRETQ